MSAAVSKATPVDTRGARKLAAALERFGLTKAIRGARAIDVGASTGGFTATLLAHGARDVTAIDVGSGQLARALRDDPRVHALERTDFRRASLDLAPGPFDFFSVDVSFMAARNVLRPLAFRLRDGAQGVLLLKPQFELPKSRVRGGEVRDAGDRRAALERLRERAQGLGFELLAHIDSPVSGGSGSVEVLVHLRFKGRSEKLPARGEKKAKQPAPGTDESTRTRARTRKEGLEENATKKKRPEPGGGAEQWFAVSAPGLEEVLAEELRAIGLEAVTAGAGGVEFRGPLSAGFAANLRSRVATRVLLRLGEVDAREFAQLRHRAARLPFERWLPRGLPVRVDVSTRRCRLYHTAAIAETVLLAASDRIGEPVLAKKGGGREDEESAPEQGAPGAGEHEHEHADAREQSGLEPYARVLIRGSEDRFAISVDSSGALLHRRGARLETGRAPLRETLAAGLLLLAGYRGDEPLVNAMCGAGTIALEAAAIALAHAPGRRRGFALERFPLLAEQPELRAALEQERARLTALERAEAPAPLYAFDRDGLAIARAQRNAERAGLASQLNLQRADLAGFAPPCAHGLLVANPPYGKRLGAARELRASYGELGRVLRERWRGFRAAVLLPRTLPPSALGLRGARTFPLVNGGIPVTLLVAEL